MVLYGAEPYSIYSTVIRGGMKKHKCHPESRWRNSYVLVHHFPLLRHLLGVAPSTFTPVKYWKQTSVSFMVVMNLFESDRQPTDIKSGPLSPVIHDDVHKESPWRPPTTFSSLVIFALLLGLFDLNDVFGIL